MFRSVVQRTIVCGSLRQHDVGTILVAETWFEVSIMSIVAVSRNLQRGLNRIQNPLCGLKRVMVKSVHRAYSLPYTKQFCQKSMVPVESEERAENYRRQNCLAILIDRLAY